MTQSLRLDRDNRKLLGVCAGLGRTFGIDALLVRIAFITTVLVGFGFPILLYFIIALLAD
jgi:phage shock protein C